MLDYTARNTRAFATFNSTATRDELLVWLGQRLSQMPQQLSDAFIMCEYERHNIKTAAGHTGVSVGIMKSRLRQARLWLAQDYSHEWAHSLAVPEFIDFVHAAIDDWSSSTEVGRRISRSRQKPSQSYLQTLSELSPLAHMPLVGLLIASGVILLLVVGLDALVPQPRAWSSSDLAAARLPMAWIGMR